MKRRFLKALPLLAFVFMYSCQKSNNTSQPASSGTMPTAQQKPLLLSVTNDVNTAGDVEDDASVDALSDGVTSSGFSTNGMGGDSTCRQVTYIPAKNIFPHQTIIDFGNGCLGQDGITRKGKKIITVYVNPLTASVGTELSLTTFSNFYEDSTGVQGEIKIYKATPSSDGFLVFNHTENITLTGSNGSVKSSYGTTVWKEIAGDSTAANKDNVFSITGSTSGTETLDGATALTFKTSIDEFHPIIKPVSCYFRTQGGVNININLITGGPANFTEYLDYGNGECDDIATLSLNGGTPQQITLPLQFWPLSL